MRDLTEAKRAEEAQYFLASIVESTEDSIVTLQQDIKALFNSIDRIKNSKSVETYDTIRLKKDGALINLEVVLSPIKSNEGTVIGVSTIARDVTHRIESQKRPCVTPRSGFARS